MVRTSKDERQKVFGLRTDNMNTMVYNHLDKKARSKQLASYLITLVEKDLKGQEPFNAKEELLEVSKNQEHMMIALEQLTRQIATSQVAPSSLLLNSTSTTKSLKDDLLVDVGNIGQLITNQTITGSLDEEDMEELDF